MNRTVKDATIKAFHYPDLAALQAHVLAFVPAYNLAKRLKALRCRKVSQAIREAWAKEPATPQDQPAPFHPATEHLASTKIPAKKSASAS